MLLVHAKHDKAKSFYLEYGLEESPTDPLHLLNAFDGKGRAVCQYVGKRPSAPVAFTRNLRADDQAILKPSYVTTILTTMPGHEWLRVDASGE